MLRALVALMLCCAATVSAQATGHAVIGKVVDPNGKPVANATVYVVGSKTWVTTRTDGSYRIVAVPAGIVSVRSAYPGYLPVVREHVNIRDAVTTVNFAYVQVAPDYMDNEPFVREDTLRYVAGMIADSTGTPLTHATVFIPNTKLTTTTDSTGHYRLKGFPDGEFSVRAQAQDFRPKQIDNLKYDGKPLTVNITLYPFIELPAGPAVAPSRLRR